MRNLLKSTAIALGLTGLAFATAGTANAGHGYYDNGGTTVRVDFGTVGVGYRDGYWDRGHQWHRWGHSEDYRSYRAMHGSVYRDWNHDRDGGDGWVQPVAVEGGYGGPAGLVQIDYGNVAFGYRDGYWDNGHRWHRWNNDHDFQGYRGHQGNNYHDWNHDRDGDHGWKRN